MDSAAVARALAEESIVLLKNEKRLLPLAPGTKVAIFGRTPGGHHPLRHDVL